MVLESIKVSWIEQRPYIAVFLGIIYTFIGYFVAKLFFGTNVSIAMLFLSTLLIVPSLIKLLEVEEKRESKYGLKHFIKEHKDVIEAYIFLFVGIFVGYLLLGFIVQPSQFNSVFEFQMNFLSQQEGLSGELIDNFVNSDLDLSLAQVGGIIENNLMVTLICFFLSIFYGAGAIFLIVLNASIFSSFIAFVMRYVSTEIPKAMSVLGIFMIHMIPEISGFLLAAIAGGVISKALIKEKMMGHEFRNVAKDATMLLIISILLIVIAAFLEVYATTTLMKGVLQ